MQELLSSPENVSPSPENSESPNVSRFSEASLSFTVSTFDSESTDSWTSLSSIMCVLELRVTGVVGGDKVVELSTSIINSAGTHQSLSRKTKFTHLPKLLISTRLTLQKEFPAKGFVLSFPLLTFLKM